MTAKHDVSYQAGKHDVSYQALRESAEHVLAGQNPTATAHDEWWARNAIRLLDEILSVTRRAETAEVENAKLRAVAEAAEAMVGMTVEWHSEYCNADDDVQEDPMSEASCRGCGRTNPRPRLCAALDALDAWRKGGE